MQDLIQYLKESKLFLFIIIYLSFLLDNVLLTVVVPIIPDYLFSNNLNEDKFNGSNKHFGPASLSPLQRKFEALEKENGPLGALLASKAFVQLAFTPLAGYLTEILGCHIPLLLGSCNMLLASILFAYGNSYGILVLARALHGSSSAAIAVSGMSILAKNVPKQSRNRLMPLAFGGIALGVLIGYPLGGIAYQFFGKPAPFLFISFFISVSIILQVFCLKDDEIEENVLKEGIKLNWMQLLKDPDILIVMFAIGISTSSMAILEPCIPMYLLAHLYPPPSRWQLGAVFIPDSVGYFIGSHFTGLIPIAPWRRALSSMVLTGLSCCTIPLATSISQLTIPHFTLGLSVGAIDASLLPLLANLVDKKGSNQYGPVYALQQIAVSLAYSFGPLLGGQAIHIIGFPWLMRFIGFFNFIFCPFLLEVGSTKENLLHDKSPHQASYSSLDNTLSISNEGWE